jgi:3-methyladenine DNA glycosylase/8-oxoguanine DNA glycosylase
MGWEDAAMATPGPPSVRVWRPDWPIDLARTLAPLAHGRGDPTIRISPGGVWWATRAHTGPVTLHLARSGQDVLVRGWGAGAPQALADLPRTLGADDDPAGFPAGAHPVMAVAHARFDAGIRTLRTSRVLDALVPAVLEQRVTGREAARAWRDLVGQFGERAPGAGEVEGCPADLMLSPDAQRWREVPSWAWHRAGVDAGRAATVVRAAQRGPRLEGLCELPPAEAGAALRSLPGIGAWTAAEVAVRAWGDRDAVSFGDFHLAGTVVHALTGRRGGTDAQMAELLEPWAGQRARAVRLLVLQCGHPPRRGPRAAITDHRRR